VSSCRHAAVLLLLAVTANAQEIRDTITVERILIDVRVTGLGGDPIPNLEPKDFRVRIDKVPATVESVEWIPESAGARELAALDKETAKTSLDVPAPQGRLLIFFFQTDFARESLRIRGQMKILPFADQLLDSLEPEDRVAVVSFDSHLKFRLDFSDDRDAIRKAMRESLAIDDPPRPPVVPMPSLGRALNDEALHKAVDSDRALFLLGNALLPIPGPKSLILFGWGLGKLWSGHVVMEQRYAVAQRALEASRTSVFSLDITQADWHSLGVGLEKAAADTGGFYAETFHFPQLAIERLQRTLEGHYELEVKRPPTKVVGIHSIEVDVPSHRSAQVMSRRTFIDK
jgi:VWFA-related protein